MTYTRNAIESHWLYGAERKQHVYRKYIERAVNGGWCSCRCWCGCLFVYHVVAWWHLQLRITQYSLLTRRCL